VTIEWLSSDDDGDDAAADDAAAADDDDIGHDNTFKTLVQASEDRPSAADLLQHEFLQNVCDQADVAELVQTNIQRKRVVRERLGTPTVLPTQTLPRYIICGTLEGLQALVIYSVKYMIMTLLLFCTSRWLHVLNSCLYLPIQSGKEGMRAILCCHPGDAILYHNMFM
jgi:hypothetical protein